MRAWASARTVPRADTASTRAPVRDDPVTELTTMPETWVSPFPGSPTQAAEEDALGGLGAERVRPRGQEEGQRKRGSPDYGESPGPERSVAVRCGRSEAMAGGRD